MSADALHRNAEARFRAGALWAWRAALFLVGMLAGALVWRIVLRPLWDAFGGPAALRADPAGIVDAMLRAGAETAPAILLALAAGLAACVLRRFAFGRARHADGATAMAAIGVAVFLAGLMMLFGTPSLLAMLAQGGWAGLHAAFDPAGMALTVLGLIMAAAARVLGEAG